MGGVFNPYDDTALLVLIALLQVDVDAIEEDVNAIREVTDAEPVLEETAGEITTDGTEQTVYTNETPAGVFRPVCFKIDLFTQTESETVILRTYYRIAPGGGMAEQDRVTYAGAQDPELINIDLEPNRYGIRITIEKTAGTNRGYDWEVFYEVH